MANFSTIEQISLNTKLSSVETRFLTSVPCLLYDTWRQMKMILTVFPKKNEN